MVDGGKRECEGEPVFVLGMFGLCPIQMDAPRPSRCSSAMSFLVALALFCPFLFGSMTGGRQGTELSSLNDNNGAK